MEFKEKTFNIGELKGISSKTIEEHLKLYAGYVKHANLILSKIPEYESYVKDDPSASFTLTLLQKRFSFEFGGIRNHEIYFTSLEDGSHPMSSSSPLAEINWERFKTMALTRGVGWAMLGYDKKTSQFIQYWVDEQHVGQLPEVSIILALDMWEHSFVADYQPSGKKQYVEDFFANLNWSKIEENFNNAK